MKSLLMFGILCSFGVFTNAQVFCKNFGSLQFPVGPCCDQTPGEGLGGALNEMIDLMDLKCMVNMYFDRIISDRDMKEFQYVEIIHK